MGADGQMSGPPKPQNSDAGSDVYRRVPHSKPPFTLSQIKKAIPPHCFKRSLIRSFSYVVSDLAVLCLLAYVCTHYFHRLPRVAAALSWPAFWLLQGFVLVGYWCLAHECGHHAFSEYEWLDDVVGFVIHSSILVPYFSWKLSHRLHHANIALLEKDESFVPKFKSDIPWYYRHFNHPPGRVLIVLGSGLAGWPLYLACNITGRSYDRLACHFDPYSPMYADRDRTLIFLSDAGVLASAYAWWRVAEVTGFSWFFAAFVAPMLVMHATVVLIIYLHHTHPSLPHYNLSEWDWLQGALSTVDRDYGVLNKVFHHIADTHVLHHLLSSIPHYHAEEATRAIKPVLGEYYQSDRTPIQKALWREVRECIYVEPDEGCPNKNVFWFNNKVDGK
ncbi:delta(12)-fatty-acid desaturase FAD2-like [Malania oleifera]|uniref:delta(12)-fatty-acid desaturase FAD2-like n=1 Tax=Malania oleifera TaxID=397392 RepID=UPI0025ADC99A|nr:delta(12)-fatty-acid desaturase FAD2-like [Malania oleifera]XP_057979976.1 delta(12)-fatty-acid desaturase FAD2-like [Malania oleifera]XP_057979977.1 delta(12)-fatty-acid desaturase FAD2-like [Malania oleifera]XP_057979978.1 delta(12)-fatty-acid desaturase FAD2-like [Malania oleifera]